MIYITGDTHGEFLRFNASSFPEQESMTKEDVVIICGDFGGIWRQVAGQEERYWMDWLNDKPFTLLWVDGNHENYTRLNSNEFPMVNLYGGQAQQIRPSIFRLLRGEVYEIQGKKVFAFGGASSHDIEDGILDPNDYDDPRKYNSVFREWRMEGRMFRVKGVSWWPEELPNEAEMGKGLKALKAVTSGCIRRQSRETLMPKAMLESVSRKGEGLDETGRKHFLIMKRLLHRKTFLL